MSKPVTPVVEYYVQTDIEHYQVHLMKYVFDGLDPNGAERKLLTINYDGKSGFKYKTAKAFVQKICDTLTDYPFDDESDVYKRGVPRWKPIS